MTENVKKDKHLYKTFGSVNSHLISELNRFNQTVFTSDEAARILTIEELINLLKKYKPSVEEIKRKNYKYVLSTSYSEEVLLTGWY